MLTAFRNSAKNIVGVAIIVVLCLAFAVWGSGSLRSVGPPIVAKVGDVEIGAREISQEFEREVRDIIAQAGGAFTRADAVAAGLHIRTLNGMVERAALDAKAERLGLATTDETLAEALRAETAFHNPVTGEFERDVYRERLFGAGLTVSDFEREVRKDLRRAQLVGSVAASVVVDDALVEAIYRRQAERRSISFLMVQPAAAGDPPTPTEDDLRAFHETFSDRYRTPEYRDLEIALMDVQSAAQDIEISEDDIKQLYDFKQAEFVEPERRTVRFLRYDTKEEAAAAIAKLAADEDFAALAEAAGVAEDDATRTDATPEDFLDPGVGEAAFAAEAGLVPEPVEGAFGFSLVEVLEVTTSEATPLDDVRDELRAELAEGDALEIVYDLAGRFDDARAEGASLAEAAAQTNVTLIEVIDIDAAGARLALPEGDEAPAPVDPLILAEAFTLEAGDESDLIQLEDGGYAVVSVTEIEPASVRPFEDIRDTVAADWKGDWLRKKLDARVEELLKRLRAGLAFDALAEETGRALLTRQVSQQTADDTLSGSLVTRLFAARLNDYVAAPAGVGASRVIAQVQAIERPDLEESALDAQAIDQFRDQLASGLTQETLDAFVAAVRSELGETFNEAEFQKLFPSGEAG